MQGLSLTDALRYFFAPFVVFLYLIVYDPELAKKLQEAVGLAGSVAFLVAGSVSYFVYRYLIYDPIVLWLHDISRKETYRRYLGQKYEICKHKYWLPCCSLRAKRLYLHVQFPNDLRQKDTARVTAAGVHLLYQASLLALPFLVLSIGKGDHRPFVFAASVLIFGFTGILADKNYEENELIQLKAAVSETDKAAELCGFARKTE